MKIVHIAPYGPNTAGIYEACRDMMKADVLSGHQVHFVDRGHTKNGKIEFFPTGTVDDRVGFKVITANPIELDDADIIIAHAMPHGDWMIRSQAPIIFVVHGRPLYSFRLEYARDEMKSYTYIHDIANYPRVKKMLYFWSEFKPFWMFPEDKHLVLDYPIIDQVRFSPKGEKHIIEDKHKGDYNILLCDSWREDVDMFEIFNGALQAARNLRNNFNIKFHLYATETKNDKLNPCWELMIHEMKKLGCMGELCKRMLNMEQVYRSMDAVLTPHRIITRVIGESLSCGTPVIADDKCKVAQFGHDPHNPHSIAYAIDEFIHSDKKEIIKKALSISKHLGTDQYSQQMNCIYNKIKGE